MDDGGSASCEACCAWGADAPSGDGGHDGLVAQAVLLARLSIHDSHLSVVLAGTDGAVSLRHGERALALAD